MRNLCFTSLCFILSFYASVEHSAGSAVPDPPQQLTCNGTKNPDGSFTYRLVPAPTVTEYTSFSWANNSITIADDHGDKTADVLKLTKDSVTLKFCQENVTYENHGANPQEASCHVNCSGHVTTTPSAEHLLCLSDDRCPPVRDVLLVVGAVVLVLLLVGALVCYRRIHPRCSRGSEEGPSVKSSITVEVPLLEIKTVL